MPPSPGSTISHHSRYRLSGARWSGEPSTTDAARFQARILVIGPNRYAGLGCIESTRAISWLDVAVELLRIAAGDIVSKRELRSREREQRPALGGVEPQRAGERVEHVRRGVDVAPLLEPRVPGHADPRQRGELLTPQAGRPAAAAIVREPDVRRRQPRPPRAQECPQLIPPRR